MRSVKILGMVEVDNIHFDGEWTDNKKTDVYLCKDTQDVLDSLYLFLHDTKIEEWLITDLFMLLRRAEKQQNGMPVRGDMIEAGLCYDCITDMLRAIFKW